ncbi:MAG: alanine--tRNA ligase [bacterium]
MKTTEIRQRFLDYFAARGHQIVPSSSLVPSDDATLLFTNAGMVQFKDVFLGVDAPPHPRAVTAQRCVRAGGKHNDLDNVGYTARHHTFFEMLGNFSFGDYFKREAIDYAWALLTDEFALPPERLWVTVFEDDDEAADLWLNRIGVRPERFARIGAHDNFWSMGDTGPCGPCSEVFYDHGAQVAGGPPGSAEQEGDRFVEIWNLVFMQYNRDADGELVPLPKPSVDTGMGLERIAAVLQGVHSNYDIDLFRNLITAAADALGARADHDNQSLRVIADHIRSTALLIADGVMPSNEGRGYVLRRIIRRAVRHGYQLGCRAPFMHKLVAALIAEMGAACPELVAAHAQVERILQSENEKFNETLEQGLRILDREIAALDGKVIPGDAAFRLYDTFGFPLDLTADVAREHGLGVDADGFDRAMAAQRAHARAASQFGEQRKARVAGVEATRFVGHQDLRGEAKVVALLDDSQPPKTIECLRNGERGIVVLECTPFYAESGGQVGDRGEIRFGDAVFAVDDTQYLANRVIAHIGAPTRGDINVGDLGEAQVDADLRRDCAGNHSATHLLHAALKSVLGAHVQQKGSLVEPKRLRFDFAHFEAVGAAQLADIESLVNRSIRANAPTSSEVMDLEQAKADGAEALFGEKYDSRVRTVRIGGAFSFELCGGTHVERSGDIGAFKIIAESGIAAGVRRIEALTGAQAEAWIARRLALLDDAAATLKATPERIEARLKSLLDDQRAQQKQIQSLQHKLAAGDAARPQRVEEINGVKVVAVRHDQADAPSLRALVDRWKRELGSGIVLVAGAHQGKAILIAGVTGDLAARYHAGRLIETLAPLVGGRGGGKPELAQGGGGRVDAIEQAIAALPEWVAGVAK